MFKKLKQRIEEGEPPSAVSSPKSIVPKSTVYVRPHGKLYRENKWEKRRVSTASLYSSKESMESDLTISRSSPTSDIPSPSDLPSISSKVWPIILKNCYLTLEYKLEIPIKLVSRPSKYSSNIAQASFST